MSWGGNEYDRGVNTFSPEGRIYQIEYSMKAVKLGSTAIGIRTKEGIVMVVEKRTNSTLLETTSIEKIAKIDEHIGCSIAGITSDSRTLIEHARVEAQNHLFMYNERISTKSVTQAICDLSLSFGENDKKFKMSRPFGVSLIIAGVDPSGKYKMYHTDPSGTFIKYKAKAIGSGFEGAQNNLDKFYRDDMTFKEAQDLALKTLKEVMEKKISKDNVEIACVRDSKFRIYTQDEVLEAINDCPFDEQEE